MEISLRDLSLRFVVILFPTPFCILAVLLRDERMLECGEIA